mgnify:FL=1
MAHVRFTPITTQTFACRPLAPLQADWWTGFDDPILTDLVEMALRDSPTLTASDAIIDQTEILLRRARLAGSPATAAGASAQVGRNPGRNQDVDLRGSASLSASWEYDAFGRIAAQVQSATYDIESARQNRRDLATIIASETALAYAELRGAQIRLGVAIDNADAQAEGLELIETLVDNGRSTMLDYERAAAQYHATLSTIPTFEATIASALNRLSALTGRSASDLDPLIASALVADIGVPTLEGPIAAGSIDDLMERRPDIRLAQADLASQLALSEAARARLFPTITINASASALLTEAADVLRTTSLGFGIGPSISWEGPDLRRVYADIDISDARVDQLAAIYNQTVLDALSEVESALSDYAKELERRDDLIAASAAAERALELARLRFSEGLDDYLDVLDAQRPLLTTQDQLASSRTETSRRAIRTYRALGGIWTDDELSVIRSASLIGN